jgi:hypothetical protein
MDRRTNHIIIPVEVSLCCIFIRGQQAYRTEQITVLSEACISLQDQGGTEDIFWPIVVNN